MPPWNGSTGSTIGACSSRSATSRRPKPRPTTTLRWNTQPWPHNLTPTASGKPGAVQAEIDTPFKEAVLVGAIVKAFHEDNRQPIGNFRLQKAVYFARRQMGESALDKDYLRKAAGPYSPKMRYSGGIKIATDKNWIKRATGKYGEGNALGDSAAEMDEWIERYQF